MDAFRQHSDELLAVKHEQTVGETASSAAVVVAGQKQGAEAVNVSIVIENDTPYEIEDIVIIHKYNGLAEPHPKTHVLVWNDIKPQALSAAQPVMTEIGWNALREDWYIFSWRFKHRDGHKCPCCVKEDNACETWLSDPENTLGQIFMDPVTYVKIVGAVVNTVTTVLSLGTATIAAVAATTVLSDILTDVLTADDNTDGFKACGLNSIDWENSQRGFPVRMRITPNFQVGDFVMWRSEDEDVPKGMAGVVIELKDEDPADLYRVRVQFYCKKCKDKKKVWLFKIGSLKFAFRIGDTVEKKDKPGVIGSVVTYTGGQGWVLCSFNGVRDWYKQHQLSSAAAVSSQPRGAMPVFKVETLLYEEGTKELPKKGVGAASDKVRWGCSTAAKAMPCVVNSPEPMGKQVPVTVINKSKKPIKKFAVVHKFSGLDPQLQIVDSDQTLEVGASSYIKHRKPTKRVVHFENSYCDDSVILAREGIGTVQECEKMVKNNDRCGWFFHYNGDECLCAKKEREGCNRKTSSIGNNVYKLIPQAAGTRYIVREESTKIYAGVKSNDRLSTIHKGAVVTASGNAVANRGTWMLPIEPNGAVDKFHLEELDDDPNAVRTDTGFGFHNDWWAVAWAYDEPGEGSCKVSSAMDFGFLKELINNPLQKLLNIGVAITSFALGVPVLWSGIIDVGKFSVEKYVRNSNDINGEETKPAYELFGVKLLQLLADAQSVRGFAKCNLGQKDVEKGEKGKPMEIIIMEDRVVIRAKDGDNECVIPATPELSCLHSETCFETETCKALNARTHFALPAAVA